LNSDGRDNYVLRRLKDTQTIASALSPPPTKKIADYLENRKISPAIRAQSTLQRIGIGKRRTL
jgi:hypothetical protein